MTSPDLTPFSYVVLTLVEPEKVDAVYAALQQVETEHDVQGEVKCLKPASSGVGLEHF